MPFDYEAIIHPLGYYRAAGSEPRYYFAVRGGVVCYRGTELASYGGVMDIVDDIEHWRRNFPRCKGSAKVDWRAAAGALIKSCLAAGEYDPPEHLKPRGAGRPRASA